MAVTPEQGMQRWDPCSVLVKLSSKATEFHIQGWETLSLNNNNNKVGNNWARDQHCRLGATLPAHAHTSHTYRGCHTLLWVYNPPHQSPQAFWLPIYLSEFSNTLRQGLHFTSTSSRTMAPLQYMFNDYLLSKWSEGVQTSPHCWLLTWFMNSDKISQEQFNYSRRDNSTALASLRP